MADEKHLKIIEQGVDPWNRWREEHTDVRPDLVTAHPRRNPIAVSAPRTKPRMSMSGRLAATISVTPARAVSRAIGVRATTAPTSVCVRGSIETGLAYNMRG